MTQIIALAMQKGGTGKTTTTLNLGVELAKLGSKVLLIDIDPQANLTSGLGFDPESLEFSVYDVLLNPSKGIDFAIITTPAGVDLVPSTLALAGAENELAGKFGRELILRKALDSVTSNYDYILIDPPPSLGIFTINALVAADSVIAPLQAQTYAFRALPQLEETITLAKGLNVSLRLAGILLTMFDKRTSLSPAVERQAREKYGDLVFTTIIPDTTKLAEAPTFGEPISTYAPGSPAAKSYEALAQEVKDRYHA
jgi:chromosome partitioning protein